MFLKYNFLYGRPIARKSLNGNGYFPRNNGIVLDSLQGTFPTKNSAKG